MLSAPVLSLRGITKAFPGVQANDGIDLDIHGGEIHALVGENGAGKSTLMKILYGFYRAYAGAVEIDGQPVEIRSPEAASRSASAGVFAQPSKRMAAVAAPRMGLHMRSQSIGGPACRSA